MPERLLPIEPGCMAILTRIVNRDCPAKEGDVVKVTSRQPRPAISCDICGSRDDAWRYIHPLTSGWASCECALMRIDGWDENTEMGYLTHTHAF